MSHHPRRILTPQASRKRKEREAFYQYKLSASVQAQAAANTTASKAGTPNPICSNGLLAGYMAYEFLTKGTLMGEKYDPARAEAMPVSGSSAEPSVKKKEHKSYAEVASILKSDGAHIPGIVNPTQLSRKQHSVEASAIVIDGYQRKDFDGTSDQHEDFDGTGDQHEDFDSTGDNREDFDGSRTTPVTRPTVLVNHDLRSDERRRELDLRFVRRFLQVRVRVVVLVELDLTDGGVSASIGRFAAEIR
ncbi:hypothetical protein LWI28_002108 [Acer negundo]|uniref:Uncharacterized protein n=1 Tax=Acer negundo TaxID=4023 RepID=A0AAD5P0T1_ACENE|nr:hypothetical protein LWI28_002108 [Acer negundo]